MKNFDVIVVGGGHAGTEAALASARMGAKTLLLTHHIETLGQMSCNPAIGGIGKGHLVKEIDALGGIMGRAADQAGIQFRILNDRKGPAVQATRAQADRNLYRQAIREALEQQPNLQIFQQEVVDLILEKEKIIGVLSRLGLSFYAKSVILTAGTFLSGKIHVGMNQSAGGRAGCPPSIDLSHRLRDLPFRIGRLKTGTPPRINGRTVNFSILEKQWGTTPIPYFSTWLPREAHPEQIPCHITYTTEKTHDIIRENLHLSAMYSGNIEGIGPRYCPSIEDKIVRFSDKPRHQIFVEPEGLKTVELYPNGLSTSLPFEVQEQFIRSIIGFEQAEITRPGYAIEYDYFNPEQLHPTLETKVIENLFFAGQINGTTGYEEAAAQGLIAGINAAQKAHDRETWYPKRHEAYIGVLIDDLITLGTTEPYRMFTSRAEHRLLLREDNADLRLSAIGYELGAVTSEQWAQVQAKQAGICDTLSQLKKSGLSLLKRPEISIRDSELISRIVRPEGEDPFLCAQILDQVQIQIKYEGYIRRQQEDLAKIILAEDALLGESFDYSLVKGLSNEVREKLSRIKPQTLGMAGRIPGVTPAAIALLMIYRKKMGYGKK